MSADESSRDDSILESIRQSGLFGPRGSGERTDLSAPSFAEVREATRSIDSAIELGVSGEDLEAHVREVCARCFPGRSAVFFLDDAPERLRLSRDAAERFEVSREMLDEAGVEPVDSYRTRFDPSTTGFDVPIVSEGELLGVLALEYVDAPARLDDDREALGLVAFAIGSAISRARASDASRQMLDRLKRSQKLATIGELTASIAHEMNHPLTTISVYADLLHRRAGGQGRDEWEIVRLSRIAAASERMQAYVRDLIDYARPDRHAPASEEPRAIIDRALAICEPAVGQAGATVSVEVAPDTGALHCVGREIEQLFVNLVINAAHAVDPAPGGAICIRARRSGAEVLIVVEDDGPGIPDELRESIFDPFFSTKAPGAGTGLGLSIVHRIVEEHGGRVRVCDGTLGGAAFEVALPAARRDG